MKENDIFGVLHFVTNNPSLFEIIEQVTNCEPIGCFSGRIYRMEAREKHGLDWHDDLISHRMVAMSINLSERRHRGGSLQIRERKSKRIVFEFRNTNPGDAILFRISPFLEHRLTETEGRISKTAFSGWFQSKPNYPQAYKNYMSKMSKLKKLVCG